MNIRLAIESDIPQLIALSDSADFAAHWTPEQWADVFRPTAPKRVAWIAEHDSSLLGFLVALHNPPEFELENVAVAPEFRRQGIGRALVSTLLNYAHAMHSERILLELRASNQSAFQLYSLSGFEVIARRREYYANPSEDALIMVHKLEN